MASSPLTAVPTAAIDIAGLSTVTSPQNTSDPRAGSIYTPSVLAAAQPIWFHPLKNGTSYLMVTARSWTAATPGGGIGYYSAFTESLAPGWVVITNGTAAPATTPLTLNTAVSSATLTAAASRPPDYLWLLHSAQINGNRQGVIQHWDVDLNGSLTNGGEEVLPATATVVFDKGIEYATPYLNIYGTDSSGNLYRIRKAWSRVGFNKVSPVGIPAAGQVWEYYTGSGWSTDVTELAPIQAGLTSQGPVAFDYYRTMTVMSTVESVSTTRTGRFWTSTSGRPWVKSALTVPLGTAGSTYLGGTVQIQSQLGASPDLLSSGVNAGIVYLTTKKLTSSSNSSLANSWAVFPVTL